MIVWFEVVFWISLFGLAHSYLFYPLLVVVIASVAMRLNTKTQPSIPDSQLPSLTVLIAAYNAELHIRNRIENILLCDYPSDLLRVKVASDGSTDRTAAIVRSMESHQVQCIEIPHRMGKAAALVQAVKTIDSEIVLFSDASTQFSPSAIKALASRFADPKVGIVSGRVEMLDASENKEKGSEGIYWQWESLVRQAESKLGILTGVSGAIYAIRRSQFVAPTGPTTNDDMVFPILAKHHHDCAFVFEPEAVANVIIPSNSQLEFRRRRRIGCGAFQSLGLLWPALLPNRGVSALALLSHKILRWMGPFLLITTYLSNAFLVAIPLYQWTFSLQSIAYFLALFGWFAHPKIKTVRSIRMATSFVAMNVALIAGFCDWITERGSVTWEPTPRPNRFTPHN